MNFRKNTCDFWLQVKIFITFYITSRNYNDVHLIPIVFLKLQHFTQVHVKEDTLKRVHGSLVGNKDNNSASFLFFSHCPQIYFFASLEIFVLIWKLACSCRRQCSFHCQLSIIKRARRNELCCNSRCIQEI